MSTSQVMLFNLSCFHHPYKRDFRHTDVHKSKISKYPHLYKFQNVGDFFKRSVLTQLEN
jgi:hypothetical protein